MEIYEKLKGVRLLILDDVGKEKPSDFTRELYWYLINERVASALPVVMTCRLPLEGNNSLQELMGTGYGRPAVRYDQGSYRNTGRRELPQIQESSLRGEVENEGKQA